jgi:hypothetical protein
MSIQEPLGVWLLMLGAMAVSSAAGLALARRLSWTSNARLAGIPIALGLGVAPMLLGLTATLALCLLPGRSHLAHAMLVSAVLASIAFTNVFGGRLRSAGRQRPQRDAGGRLTQLFGALLILWMLSLIIASLYRPLLQNDALEYMTVGRILFDVRAMSAYPVLDPQHNAAGFFGPWTHPPLYVALLYISNVLQGHADSPGMARLIAPWAALCTVYLTYALGRLWGPLTGVLAALILISAPLYFLGASAALIDPLPVLGLATVMAAVVGLEPRALRSAVARGAVIGAAMWTHSQAILLAPIGLLATFVHDWPGKPRTALRNLIVIACSLLVVSAWPYVRNVRNFGSMISDTPLVFALPSLAWDEYFRMQRGYDTWLDMIQYGILKGWFAPEAYSLGFWLLLLGAGVCLHRIRRSGGVSAWLKNGLAADECALIAILSAIACYLGGMAVSALAGIDLMIRNERYLLMLLPCVAVIGAVGLAHVLGGRSAAGAHSGVRAAAARNFVAAASVAVLALPLAAVGAYTGIGKRLSGQGGEEAASSALRSSAAYNAAEFIRLHTPPDAIVLSLKPADMYYADRRMISYLDPRMQAFYAEENLASAFELLRRLGVRYLHVPDYSLPPFYNSTLQELAARPEFATLLFSSDGHQVYELRRQAPEAERDVQDLLSRDAAWTRIEELTLGGRKNLLRIPITETVLRGADVASHTAARIPVFRREQSAILISGSGGTQAAGTTAVRAQSQYLAKVDLEGHAFVHIMAFEYDAAGTLLGHHLIGETALGERPERLFLRRFVTGDHTAFVRIAVEHRGVSSVRIRGASLSAL